MSFPRTTPSALLVPQRRTTPSRLPHRVYPIASGSHRVRESSRPGIIASGNHRVRESSRPGIIASGNHRNSQRGRLKDYRIFFSSESWDGDESLNVEQRWLTTSVTRLMPCCRTVMPCCRTMMPFVVMPFVVMPFVVMPLLHCRMTALQSRGENID